jgi:hypothetical protein
MRAAQELCLGVTSYAYLQRLCQALFHGMDYDASSLPYDLANRLIDTFNSLNKGPPAGTLGVGPGRYYPPLHPMHLEKSLLKLNNISGIL